MRPQRAAHEKSRNGCLTCKIRRVKCDETRPHCRKCTETGRKCEGPSRVDLQFRFVDDRPDSRSRTKRSSSGTSSSGSSTPPSAADGTIAYGGDLRPIDSSLWKDFTLRPTISILKAQHSDIEIRSFDHFIHRAAPCYAGAVEDDFWRKTVPCLALSDPVIWDITVASSYMFEHVPHTPLVPSFTIGSAPRAMAKPHRQALKWYNRALSNIRQKMDQDEMDSTYAMLTCILCTCIEFQQKNIGMAMDLVHSGYRVLSQSLLVKDSITKSAQARALNDVVISFFSRHALVVANFVVLPLSEWVDHPKDIEAARQPYTSLKGQVHNARLELYQLMYQAYEILRITVLMWNIPEVIDGQRAGQRVTLDEMERWRLTYTERCLNAGDDMASDDMQLLTAHLLLSYEICYTWLSTCTDTSEMAYDQHMDRFAEIVQQAERVLMLGASKPGGHHLPSHTTVNMNVIPPLYFAVLKCRDPVLRRKALYLLERAPPEELWAGVLTTRVAENAIALEEDRPYQQVDLADPASLAELRARPLPPESRRLRDIALTGQEQFHAGTTIVMQLGRVSVDACGTKRTAHKTIRVEYPTQAIAT